MKTPHILTTTIALMLTARAFAVTETWDGGGANDNFSTGANWADNTAPVSSLVNTDLIFPIPSPLLGSFVVDVPFSARSVTFNWSGPLNGITLSGQVLNLGAVGIANDGTTGASFDNQVSFSGVANSTIDAASGLLIFHNTVTLATGTLTVTGASTTSFENISGTSTLNKTGSGVMTWTPNASTACDVTISAGTLTMGVDSVADLFTGGASIAINGTSTFNINESLTLDGAVLTRATGADMNLAAGKTLRVQGGGDVVMTGAYSNTTDSTITVTGAGSSFTGSSTLGFNGGSLLNVTAGGTVATGSTVEVGAAGSGAVVVTGSGSSLGGGNLNVGLSGDSGLAIFSSGSSGTFATINVGASSDAGTDGTVTIQSGATVTATALAMAYVVGTADGTVTITGAGSALTITGAGSTSIGASSLTTGTLNVNSSGIFNSGTGTTTVRATGSIVINGGTFNSNGNLTLTGGLLDRVSGGLVLAAGTTFTVQSGGDATFTGAYSNNTASNILVTGSGSMLSTTAALSINGGSTLSALLGAVVSTGGGALGIGTSGGNGTVSIADAGSSLSAGALNVGQNGNTGSLTFSAGSVGTFTSIGVDNSGVAGTSGLLQIQSGATVTGTSLALASTSAANTGTVTLTLMSSLTLSGAATATIGASGSSSGTLNVGTRATFNSGTGLTTVNATGTVAIIDSGTFNANGSVTLNGGQLTRDTGADFLLDAGRTFTVQAGGDATFTGAYSNGTASSIVVTGAGSTLSTTGNLGIQGGGTLSVSTGGGVSSALALSIGTTGGATVTVTGAGATLTAESTVTIGAASGSAATVNVGSGGTFTTGTGLTQVNATGDLNVNAGGTMIVRGNMTVLSGLDIAGTVILGAPGPAPAPDEFFAEAAEWPAGDLENNIAPTTVPEPGIGMLLASALALLGLRRSRSKKVVRDFSRPGVRTQRGALSKGRLVPNRSTGGEGGRFCRLKSRTTFRRTRQLHTAIALFAAARVFAVTDTWDGGGADNNLSTALNWADNTAPPSDLANTDLIFAGVVRLTPHLTSFFYTHKITFNNTAGAFVFDGQGFVVGIGGIVNNDTQTMTFDNNYVEFGQLGSIANSTINAASGGLTFNATVTLPTDTLTVTGSEPIKFQEIFVGAAGGTINKTGAGTMTLTSTATAPAHFNMIVGAGTFATGNVVFGTSASIAVNGTSIFNLQGNFTIEDGAFLTRATGAQVNLATGKTLTVQTGSDVVMTGAYSNTTASTITVTGAGSSFTGNSTLSFNGGSLLNVADGGTVAAGASVNLGTAGSGTAIVTGSGSSLGGANFNVGSFGNSAIAIFSSGSTGTFTNINVDASGTAGNDGLLSIQSGATVTGTALLVANVAAATDGTVTITGNGSELTLTGAASATIGASSLSTGTLNVNARGFFNSGTGLTTVGATGTIVIDGGTYNSNGNLTLDGGRLDRIIGGFVLAAGRTLTVQSGGDAVFTGAFSNNTSSTILVTGSGSTLSTTLALSINGGSTLAASLSGDVSASALNIGTSGNGTMTIADAGSTLTLSGTAAAVIGTANASSGTLNVQSSGTFNSGTGVTTVNATGTVAISGGTFNANGNVTLNGGQFTRDATGVFALDAARTFTVQGGGDAIFTGAYSNTTASTIVVTGAGSTLSTTGTLGIQGGSTLSVAAGGNVSSAGMLSAGTSNNGTVTVDGAGSILSSDGLNVGRSGFAGSVTFTNGSTGTLGAISVDASSTIGTSGTLGIQSGADVSGSTLSVATNAVANSGSVDILGAGSTLTISGTTTIGAASGSTGSVTVSSGGTFTTGTGLTQVNATGDLNVNAGGTMIVRGNMTVLSGLDIAGTVILGAPAPSPAEAVEIFPEPDGGEIWDDSQLPSAGVVPEPGAGVLAAIGAIVAAASRRRLFLRRLASRTGGGDAAGTTCGEDAAATRGGAPLSQLSTSMKPRILTTTIALLLTARAFAVTDTWDGGGADNNLSTALNWLDNTAPASDLALTDLIFAGAVRLTPNVSAVFSTNSLVFNNTAGAFIFAGTTLNIGAGGIVNNDTQTQTFDNAITLGAASASFNAAIGGLTFNNNVNINANTLALDGAGAFSFGVFFGGGAVNKNGAGTMTWSPNIAQTLDLAINAGTVATVADATADVFSAAASIAVNGTSIFNINENLTLDGAQLTRASGALLTLAAGKTLTLQNNADAIITGTQTFGNASTLTVTGAGSTFTTTSTLSLNGGSTTNVLAGGSVSSGSGNIAIGTSGNGTVTVDGGASSIGGGILNVGLSGAIGSLTLTNGSTGTFTTINVDNSGSVGASGTLSIQSGASVTGTNLFVGTTAAANTGTVTINGASSALTITGAGATIIGAASANTANFNVQSGGTFNSGTGTITVNATGVIGIGGTFNANGNMSLSGQMVRDVAGTFTIAQGKTLTVQGGGDAIFADTYDTGTTATNGGNLTVTGAGSTFQALDGLGLSHGSTVSVALGGGISSNSFLEVGANGNGTLTVDGAGSQISAASGPSVWGDNGGTANVTFSNNAVGTFTGALNLASSNVAGSAAVVTVQSGADVTSGSLNVAINPAGLGTGSATVTGAGSTWTITGGSTLTIGGITGSTGVLNVNSNGTFVTGTGTTLVNPMGAIAIGGGTFNSTGSLIVSGGLLTRSSGTFSLATGKTITMQNGGDATFTGLLLLSSANCALNVSGVGSTFGVTGTFITSNSFDLIVTGGGSVSAGGLQMGSGAVADILNVTGSGSTVTATGSNFALGNATATFDSVSTGSFAGLLVDPDQFGLVGVAATLAVQGGAHVTAAQTTIGSTGNAGSSNSSVITVTGAGSTFTQSGANTLAIGSSNVGAGIGTGTLNVASGGAYTSGTGIVSLNTTGTLNIDGGTLTLAGPLARNGGVLNFNTGALSIVDNFVVGLGGLLGTDVTFDTTRRFTTTATTTIDAFHTLTLNSATFSTGALVNNGTLVFNTGTLAITGAGGFNIGTGALGSIVTLGTGANLQVTNTTTVASGALLRINGGSFTGAAITNDGTIDHQDGVLNFTGTMTNSASSRLFVGGLSFDSGAISNAGRITMQNGLGILGGTGAITNTGIITGDGTIAKPVTNSAAGQLRAESGKTLVFTGAITANAGTFSLLGGTLEFTTAITNSATGFISGSGTLITAGLTNSGQLALTGDTGIYGDTTNAAGARIVTTGGATTTFYDDVIHNGTEIRTSAGCASVFLGAVSGAGPYTGTGTVYFEGDLRPGNSPASVLYEGDLVLGGAATLTMELGGLLLGGEYDHLNVGGTFTADGALDVVLYGGFAPHFGDTFDLFDAGALAGNFDDINLPALAGDLTWDDSQLASTGTLRVVPEPGVGVLLASALALLGLRRRKAQGAAVSQPPTHRRAQRQTSCAHGVDLPLRGWGWVGAWERRRSLGHRATPSRN